MEQIKKQNCKINKGKRYITADGNILAEEWVTVEGATMQETSQEFEKQWKEFEE